MFEERLQILLLQFFGILDYNFVIGQSSTIKHRKLALNVLLAGCSVVCIVDFFVVSIISIKGNGRFLILSFGSALQGAAITIWLLHLRGRIVQLSNFTKILVRTFPSRYFKKRFIFCFYFSNFIYVVQFISWIRTLFIKSELNKFVSLNSKSYSVITGYEKLKSFIVI